jgi:hypothetical protein
MMRPFLLLPLVLPIAAAFQQIGKNNKSRSRRSPRTSATELGGVSRREAFSASVAGWAALAPLVANAADNVDYGKLQDLMKDMQPSAAYTPPPSRTGRPTWLEEPTEEFKQNEARATEFKRKSLAAKQRFGELLQKLQDAPNDQRVLVATLQDMQLMVEQGAGLPQGITKEEVVKQCRRRKAKKFWPTPVEIAYQDLLMEIRYQQSPDTDRDKTFL